MTTETVPCWLLRSTCDPCDVLGPFTSEQELREFMRNNARVEDYAWARELWRECCRELGFVLTA